MKVREVRRGRNKWYVDDDNQGNKIPSVTTITKALPKDALVNWAGDATAAYAVDNWDRLAALTVAARLKDISKGRYAERDTAANRGRDVHRIGEELMSGKSVTVPDELVGHVDSYRRFMEEFDLHPIEVEQVVFSKKHYYAGRLDLIGDVRLPDLPEFEDIPRDENGFSRGLLDAKTSKSGIFGEVALQLVGYRYAEFGIGEDGSEHERSPEDVDFIAGIHIRRDGYDLIRLDGGPDVHRGFLYLKQVWQLVEDLPSLVLGTIPPPTSMSQYKLVRVSPADGPGF